MAALMEDWLGPLIDLELRYAVAWKSCPSTHPKAPNSEQNAVNDRLDKKYQLSYEDDGSNLRAKLKFVDHSKKVVQIYQVRTSVLLLPYYRSC